MDQWPSKNQWQLMVCPHAPQKTPDDMKMIGNVGKRQDPTLIPNKIHLKQPLIATIIYLRLSVGPFCLSPVSSELLFGNLCLTHSDSEKQNSLDIIINRKIRFNIVNSLNIIIVNIFYQK